MPLSTAQDAINVSLAPKRRLPVYSFDWAYSVIQHARNSHPRGWEILDQALLLSNRQLAFLLASKSPEWPIIRGIAKQIEVWDAKQRLLRPHNPISALDALDLALQRFRISPKSPFGAYLTANLKRLTLEEQLKEGQGPGPDGPCLPFGERA